MSSRDVSAIDHSIAATLSLEASSICVISAGRRRHRVLPSSRVAASRLEVWGGDTSMSTELTAGVVV
jgi:hypothetical protein